MKNFKWEGVMPAITTQFSKNYQLDINAYKTNLGAQLSAGVHGIILGGTLGEASTITTAERSLLLKTTIEQVEDKIPVVVATVQSEQSIDARDVMKHLVNQLGGSGGGRPDFAQGGVENSEDIDIALSSLSDLLLSLARQ